MWFHKSFPDFIFDHQRSQIFFCNQDLRHHFLARGCFGIMQRGLRFNIADIATSYSLDCDNPALPGAIAANIPTTLSYACRSWSSHLTLNRPASCDPLFEVLDDFLQLRILFWIEAMNLLQFRGDCEGMLLDAQKCLISTAVCSQFPTVISKLRMTL